MIRLTVSSYGPGFKRIFPHVDSVSVLKILCQIFFLSWVVYLKAALLVHCSSLFILMTFQLVIACHPIFSYLLMTPNVLTGSPLLLIVWYFRRRIHDVIRWSDEWDLKFSVSKISLARFSKKGHISLPHHYEILDHEMPLSNTARDLGVHFSADLSWSHHISIITAKAYKMLGLLRRSFTCNVLSVRKRLHISLVRSQLAAIIWISSLVAITY